MSKSSALVAAVAAPPTQRPVRAALARVARRMRWSRIGVGLSWWLATVGGCILALALLDNLLHLPAALRLVAALGALAVAVVEFARRIVRPLAERGGPEAAAIVVERGLGRDDNLLINACQFEAVALAEPQRNFVAPAFADAMSALGRLPLARLCQAKRLAAWAAAALVVVLAWAGYRVAFPDRCANALARIVAPLADVPPAGSVALDVQPGDDVVVAEGAALTVRVRAHARAGAAPAPSLVWSDGAAAVAAEDPAGENATLAHADDGAWTTTFPAVRRPFAFRVFCADSCSRSVRVRVVPMPRLVAARFAVTPPPYLGEAERDQPGPPATLAALAGSRARLVLTLDRAVPALALKLGDAEGALMRAGDEWSCAFAVQAAAPYALMAGDTVLARGAVQLVDDAAPTVELTGADANALLLPAATLALRASASDDHGLRALALAARDQAGGDAWLLRTWEYVGPPGPQQADERQSVTLDPEKFQPGHAYAITAVARDWRPDAPAATSRPIVVRIKSANDIAANGAAAATLTALKEAIARQRQALATADNLLPDIADAAAKGRLPGHRDAIADQQGKAQAAGRAARDDAAKRKDESLARALEPLVEGEMGWVLDDLKHLPDDGAKAPQRLTRIRDRQREILARLTALLGEVAAKASAPKDVERAGKDSPDSLPTRAGVDKLKEELDKFAREQERLLEKSRTLADTKPLDLSDDQAAILGELAREEAKQAKFMEEALTDFSKLPKQDFSDSTLADELNQVYQEVAAAEKSLYQKSVEMAVPQEQSGLELAKTMENNLEKWLMNHPDDQQWKMEEPPASPDVPVAELPKEMEDIVGDLLDDEEKMSPDVEDFSSAWMDSMDKGAGWDAADGPISNMSAKGVTGNLLPNEMEIGGRSGEGRNGRSHGQMAGSTAEGKGGRETPTRLDPSPFESGSVKDTSKDDGGGASGGGKVSGQAGEGLRGPVPPPLQEKLGRLAGQQAQLRQKGEQLALQLRQRKITDGAVESAVQAMQAVEDAAKRGDGGAIRARYASAVDALRAARDETSDAPASLRRERIDLSRAARADQLQDGREAVPAGYEEMVGRYFSALAEEGR